MASTTLSNPTATIGLSAAQKLMQKHQETRQPTIEDVPDEEVLSQKLSSYVPESASGPSPQHTHPFPTSVPTIPKANPAEKKDRPIIDTQSEELFPGLGAAPKASSAPIWGGQNPSSKWSCPRCVQWLLANTVLSQSSRSSCIGDHWG